jgi:hypothetical protein
MKLRFLFFLILLSTSFSFAQNPNTQNVQSPDTAFQNPDSAFQNESVKQSVDEVPTITLTDEDLKESPPSNVASVLTSARDVFASAASYTFSFAHFRIRGYDAGNEIPLMNGAPMINLENNRGLYNDWSGLNDVVRARDLSLGLAPATFSFGDIGGAYSIDSRASHQRKQLQVSYAISNRTYDNRVMISYGSGNLKNGWSYALSGSRRWANEGYIPGTYYDGWSYFGAIEKKINTDHSLALTAFGAPVVNGRSSPATAEMYDLAGTHYYNPDWGYQDGKKRNAVVGDRNQPTLILTHDWKINNKSSLLSSASYQFGKDKISGLDWFNAPDPRPDYYRNLPSFIEQVDSLQADNLFRNTEDVRQINWSRIYEANQQNIDTINGTPGMRSLYVLRNRVSDSKIFTLNTIYNETVNDHLALNGGLSYQSQSTEHYSEIKDLLGGDYYVDLNKYADTSTTNAGNISAIQNDINHPDRIVHVGDKYSYDYVSHNSKTSAWLQAVYKYDRVDFFFAASTAVNSFYRTGKYRNGIFPDDSYGDSKKQAFFNGGFKSGITYKVNGRNYLYANAAYISKAPEFEDAFFSPKTRNVVADNLRNMNIQTVEGGYLLRAPRFKARLTGYYTLFKDETRTERYFIGGNNSSFVNFTLTNMERTHTGLEAGVSADAGHGFNVALAASVGQFYYSSRPIATATLDNSNQILFKDESIYIKNLRVSGSPQSAYTLGLNYNNPNFWQVHLNASYFDNIYLNFLTPRRMGIALDAIDKDSPLWNDILAQTKEEGQFTLDISASKSWKLNNIFKAIKKNTYVVLNVGVTNITNNQDLVVSGYESRFAPFGTQTEVTKYPDKFSYGYGTTFFASLTFRMN